MRTERRLQKQADKLFQQLGLMKHKSCLCCGKRAEVIHHFITKGASAALRYDEDNGIPLCVKHHCLIHRAQDPMLIATIIQSRGEDWLEILRKKRRAKIKTTVPYYKAVIERLTKKISMLE